MPMVVWWGRKYRLRAGHEFSNLLRLLVRMACSSFDRTGGGLQKTTIFSFKWKTLFCTHDFFIVHNQCILDLLYLFKCTGPKPEVMHRDCCNNSGHVP